jgi:signal peptidase II
VFNLADSAIVCGGILTVLLAMLGYHLDGTRGTHGDRKAPPSPPGSGPNASSTDSGASPADAPADAER